MTRAGVMMSDQDEQIILNLSKPVASTRRRAEARRIDVS